MEIKVNGNNTPARKEIFFLLLCLLVAFALRFYTFDQRSLWMDEIYTFNDSRDGLTDQIKFYKENPTYLHPPLFFVLTHLFYPFTNPERDLHIIPLIFGVLSIPMLYLLSRLFSAGIAVPCTLSLTFMAYHISLSQDGRSYSLSMFLGMVGLYFFVKHLKTLRKGYLIPAALFFALLFHTSYSSIPFILLSQILWFYRIQEGNERPALSSFFIFNSLLFLFCMPWVIFVALNYKGAPMMDPFHTEEAGSFWAMIYGVFHDWVPHFPLMIFSVILLVLFPFLSKNRRNALFLLAFFVLPVAGLYIFCKLFNVTHFVSSRYFINFLPPFFIALYLSLNSMEATFDRLRKFFRLELLFCILFIASNMVILPLYYRSEKQDLRGLVTYLKPQLRKGDKIFVGTPGDIPGMLHYFGVYPQGRHYEAPAKMDAARKITVEKSFAYQNSTYMIFHSMTCCAQYVADGSRLWIVVGKFGAKDLRKNSPYVLKGFFDGSFLNFSKFPEDASIYLFLWDPKSPEEKGIDMPIE